MRNLLAGIGTTILLLLFVESCSRVVYSVRNDFSSAREEPSLIPRDMVPSAELGWERRPNYKGPVTWGNSPIIKEYDEAGYFTLDTPKVRDRSLPKIITLGDSSTFGWGVPTEKAYAEVLDDLLPEARVINLGLNGYTTYQGYRVLQKFAPILQPSIAIISFNFNDRRYVLTEGPDAPQKFQNFAAADSGLRFLQRIATARILRAAAKRAHLIPMDREPDTDIRTIQARVPPEAYRKNLGDIARYCRGNRIIPIFLLLGDNPLFTAPLAKGLELLRTSRNEDAIRVLNALAAADTFHSEIARKHLVRAYETCGEAAAAEREARIQTPRLDIGGGRCIFLDRDYNSIMEEVARAENIRVVDARPVLDEDPSIYLDFCHPDAEGHRKIAHLLSDAVRDISSRHGTSHCPGGVPPGTQ